MTENIEEIRAKFMEQRQKEIDAELRGETRDEFSDMNKKQLQEYLTQNGIEFDNKANKEALLVIARTPVAE